MNRWREHFADIFHSRFVVNMNILLNVPARGILLNGTPSIEEVSLGLPKLGLG